MESAGLRGRRRAALVSNNLPLEDCKKSADDLEGFEPPRYTIDLSLPPNQRYRHVAADFIPQSATLPVLFDEIVEEIAPRVSINKARWLACLMLRRVYYKEETEELQGISEVIGIELWLLVAFNVLLDLFMGCTSGAVRVDDLRGGTKMLHFRTLDWGMPQLRKIIVQLDFVSKPDEEVIASSITYLGYTGVLTAVRQGLTLIKSSTDFIVATNHDAAEEGEPSFVGANTQDNSLQTLIPGKNDLTEDSVYRKRLATKLWSNSTRVPRSDLKLSKRSKRQPQLPTEEMVVEWMGTFPIANELTHFAAVMDPKTGKVVWVKRYLEPCEQEWQM
ncbi:hypothetical protein P7C71_g1752, partial [Lecanoromycetidae sp. Uapishka_2]